MDDPSRTTAGQAIRNFALASVAVVVIGLVAGFFYAQGNPSGAAGALVADLVIDEAFAGAERSPASTDNPAPTSGDHQGRVRCGVFDAVVSVDDQLATLAAGGVVLQYVPDQVDPEEVGVIEELARARDETLAAPNPAMDAPVMATAWTKRMPLIDANRELLAAFVTAHGGGGPRPSESCP